MLNFLDLDAECTAEDRLVRETAREFVDGQGRPEIGTWFEAGEFPIGLVGTLGDRDFYGPTLSWGDLPGVTTAQLLVHRLAGLEESGRLEPVQVSMGKRHAVAAAREVARTAREMWGPTASRRTTRSCATSRTWRRPTPTRGPTTSTRSSSGRH